MSFEGVRVRCKTCDKEVIHYLYNSSIKKHFSYECRRCRYEHATRLQLFNEWFKENVLKASASEPVSTTNVKIPTVICDIPQSYAHAVYPISRTCSLDGVEEIIIPRRALSNTEQQTSQLDSGATVNNTPAYSHTECIVIESDSDDLVEDAEPAAAPAPNLTNFVRSHVRSVVYEGYSSEDSETAEREKRLHRARLIAKYTEKRNNNGTSSLSDTSSEEEDSDNDITDDIGISQQSNIQTDSLTESPTHAMDFGISDVRSVRTSILKILPSAGPRNRTVTFAKKEMHIHENIVFDSFKGYSHKDPINYNYRFGGPSEVFFVSSDDSDVEIVD